MPGTKDPQGNKQRERLREEGLRKGEGQSGMSQALRGGDSDDADGIPGSSDEGCVCERERQTSALRTPISSRYKNLVS